MFHWICPECGREIAPTAKECPDCDASAPAAEPAASTASETAADPSAATAQLTIASAPAITAVPTPRLSAEPLIPQAEAVRIPATSGVTPAAPLPGLAIACAAVRKTHWQTPVDARPKPTHFSDHLPVSIRTELPHLTSDLARGAAVPCPGPVPVGTVSKLQPRIGNLSPAGTEPAPQIGVPGPALAHELTSLSAAGVAKMMWFTPVATQAVRKSGMLVSAAVASGFLAVAIAGVFYAMPTMARSEVPRAMPVEPPAQPPAEPAAPIHEAPPELEVAGVRFVTDLPDRRPEIHYLVVNHTNTALNSVVVNVTLRAGADQPPLSQFSFRGPRLGPYESKEMVSTIERLNRPVDLPDWRNLQTEVELSR